MRQNRHKLLNIANKQLLLLEGLFPPEVMINNKIKIANSIIAIRQSLIGAKNLNNIVNNTNDVLRQANKIIAEQKQRICELEMEVGSFPLKLYCALGDILDHDKSFYFPQLQTLKVIDEWNENRKIDINPMNVICIISIENKPREKVIYIKEEKQDNNIYIKKYRINNNEMNFNKLCTYIDKLSHHLVNVSKNAIINVAFYDLAKDDFLQINFNHIELNTVQKIKISTSINILNSFLKIKEYYNDQILLQKKVLDYKVTNVINT